jgi:hypothetical protein
VEKAGFREAFFSAAETPEKFYAANMLIRDFLINDSIQEMDSVRVWLTRKGDLFSYFSIVDSWLQENQPDSAAQVLNAIPMLFNLTGGDLTEYNYFDSLKTIQIVAQLAEKDDDDMVLDNLTEIQGFAEAGNYLASAQAQAMINSVLGNTYEQILVLPTEEAFQSRLSPPDKKDQVAREDAKAIASVSLTAAPNPATETISVYYRLPDEEAAGKLKITTFSGLTIEEKDVLNSSGRIEFNIAHLPDGVYFCTLLSGGNKWKTIKLVVAR